MSKIRVRNNRNFISTTIGAFINQEVVNEPDTLKVNVLSIFDFSLNYTFWLNDKLLQHEN